MKSLSGCIAASLKRREMLPELIECLIDKRKSKVLHRDESDYWDYKRELKFDNEINVAEFARDVIGFHNSKGGLIVVGIEKDYKVVGVPESAIIDSYIINDKIKKYLGQINIFQNSIKINNNKYVWLIFIPKRDNSPVAIQKKAPQRITWVAGEPT